MSERQIPHLRDIFGVPFDGIESSPRSRRRRRRHDAHDFHQLASHFDSMHVSGDSSGGTTDPDSAVSVGSSGEDEALHQQEKQVKSRKSSSKRDNEFGHRTLSQKDVRHLERHLSMKKTIRKKIMRDLQQAFVEDPSEFRVDPEQQARGQLRDMNLISNLNFNGPSQQSDANFLEILRDDDRDSGHSSPTRQSRRDSRQHFDAARTDEGKRQTSFWKRFAFMGKSKR